MSAPATAKITDCGEGHVSRQLDRLSNRISAEDRKRTKEYYKKECHVRRGCNTISGIARARAYSDEIG